MKFSTELIDYPLDYVLWEVTKRCNLNCMHCRSSSILDEQTSSDISYLTATELINSLMFLNTKVLVLTGGEPLLRDDLDKIVAYATSAGLKCRLQTNGTLLNSKVADSLKIAGIYNIGIGLDSPHPGVHDKIRNCQGAFDKAILALKTLKSANIMSHVECTLSTLNADHISDMIALCKELSVSSILFRSIILCGRSYENKEYILTPSQYKTALKQIAQLARENTPLIINSQDPLYNVYNTSYLDHIKRKKSLVNKTVLCGCTLGINTLNIRSNGDVGICSFIPDIVLGNIHTTNLVDIWKNRFSNTLLAKCVDREYYGQCYLCSNLNYCGGCRARSLNSINHDLLDSDPYCLYSEVL